MGSGTSRGKRVAPTGVSEVSLTKTAALKKDNRPFKPLKIHAILRSARHRAQPNCHSEGHDSDFSREDEDVDGELDRVLDDYKVRGVAALKPPKKTLLRSKSYGLCHFRQDDEEEEVSPEEPRVSNGGPGVVNKRSEAVFAQLPPTPPTQNSSSSQGLLTREAMLEDVPTPDKQSTFGKGHNGALTMPVILYDGSEEELMDTIERDFS